MAEFRRDRAEVSGAGDRVSGFPADLAIELAEGHPFALVVLDADDRVIAQNHAARALLGDAVDGSCALMGCGDRDRCVHEEARAGGESLPEFRIDLPGGAGASAAWVVVAPLAEGRVLLQLRPADARDRRRTTDPAWRSGTVLRVHALGRTRVLSPAGDLHGSWIGNRAGQVFKYLLTHRDRPVPADELAERLWEGATKATLQSVRYFIHALRDELEPGRGRRAASSFVPGSRSGYTLNLERVHVDADDFEREVRAALAALERGDQDGALGALTRGLDLYRGDFLEDEPYAEWALEERDRLRELATTGLRAKAGLHRARGDVAAATEAHERLVRLEPFDVDLHRELLELLLAQGRRTDAARRYAALRHRLLATFGEDVDFLLADLALAG